jgi:hypothetical protein
VKKSLGPPKYRWDEINQKAVLNRCEAAFFVGLGQSSFDRRVPETFPIVKVGRRSVFLRTSLLAALAKLERQTTQKASWPLRKKAQRQAEAVSD